MIEDQIKALGLTLPAAPVPLAAYIPAVKTGNLVFTSGQLPMLDGVLKYKGKVGTQVSQDDAKRAAEIAVLNCLAVIKNVIGNLELVERVVKVTVFVNSDPDFVNQPEVANGASELLVKIFGDKGKHARAAVGVNVLPRDASVEIEMLVETENDA
ncbi:MAG: RidA family protein [Ignavibacteriaceae bacterium]|jgi:enamine deaminase RidA (YjgF/YER057c/UK114 family)|nr:RidA family protein [Ignavibacteriaceae bacterium]